MAGEVKVVMTFDDRDFTIKMVKAGQTMGEFKRQVDSAKSSTKQMENGLATLGSKFKDTIFAIALVRYAFKDVNEIVLALPIAFLKAGGEMEKMMVLMEGLSKETDKLARRAEALSNTRFIFSFAQSSPFELKTLTDVFVKMKSAGIDPTAGALNALTQSVAKFGGSDEQLKRAGVAIQQMSGKGVVSMEELRQQLGEAVPNAIQLMARGMGMTMPELVKAITKGQVEARSALAKMFVQMEQDAAGSSARMMRTIPGMLSQVKTEWELFKIEVAGGGFDKIFKEQLKELITFFRSAEGKKFAQDTGAAMKSLATAVVELKDGVVALWPVIKLAGSALLFYFGGQAAKRGIDEMRQALAAKRQALEDMRMASTASARADIRNAQDQISINNALAANKTKTIEGVLGTERRAHIEKINLAKAELETAKRVAAQKLAEANLATARAGVLYAEAVKFERAIGEIDASGKARQGAKRDNFVANMNAYREETAALQTKAVAIRQTAAETVRMAEAKVAATRADRSYVAVANQQVSILEAQRQNLQNANASLIQMIGNKEALISKTSTAGVAITTFGKSLLSMVGWGLAVQGTFALITFLYDKIAGSAKRAADQVQALQNIRLGEANQKDLADAKALKQSLEDQIAIEREQIAVSKQRGTFKEGSRGSNAQQARLDALLAQLSTTEQAIGRAKDIIERNTGAENAGKLVRNLEAAVEERELKSAARGALNQVNEQLIAAEAAGNKKLVEDLRKQKTAADVTWIKEKMRIAQELYEQELPNAKAAGGVALRKFNEEYNKFVSGLRGQIDAVTSKNVLLTGDKKTPISDIKAANAESPLLKMVSKQRADLAKAQADLNTLGSDADKFIGNAQNQALFDLLGKLAAGSFDIAGTKGNPKGIEPGKGKRENLIAEFEAFLAAGKGTANDFIETLGFLDVKLKAGEDSAKTYFQQIVNGAANQAQAEQGTKALGAVMQKQAGITEELSLVTEEYNAGVSYLPASVVSLERELAKLASQYKLVGQAQLDFDNASTKAVLDALRIDTMRRSISLDKAVADSKLRGIVNVRQREAAAYRQRMTEIEAERSASIGKAAGDAALIAQIEANAAKNRAIEQARFNEASKSELDKLYDGWTDVLGNIDKAVANSASSWMTAIEQFVETGKFNIKDLVKSTLMEFAKVQVRATFGPLLNAAGNALGGVAGRVLGIPALRGVPGTQANGMPIDSSLNALRVTMVGGVGAVGEAATGGGDESPITKMFTEIKQGAMSLWDQAKTGFTSITSSLGSIVSNVFMKAEMGFGSLLQWVGTAFSQVISAIAGMMSSSGGGGGGWGEIIGAVASYFFADGGVMTSKGSMPLRKYAMGGIANSPQMAIYGEGSMAEAFVPLPDGRSIPVTMSGAAQTGGLQQAPMVTVNVINQTGQQVQAKQGAQRFDGRQMILDVVMTAVGQPGQFRDTVKQAVSN